MPHCWTSRAALFWPQPRLYHTGRSVSWIGKAIEAVLAEWGGDAAAISRVTLSTTLATNSVVEGVGGRVALVLIGFDAMC